MSFSLQQNLQIRPGSDPVPPGSDETAISKVEVLRERDDQITPVPPGSDHIEDVREVSVASCP